MSYQHDPKTAYPVGSQTPAPPYNSVSPHPIGSPQPQYQQQYDPNHQHQPQSVQHYQSPIVQSPQPAFHQQPQMEHKGQNPQGQHVHPNKPGDWHHTMCGCFGDMGKCCLGCWCPCIQYGRIQHRLRNNNDLSTYSSCNGPCWGFCALACCGFQWIMSMMQRGEIRHKHNLDGSGCGDCMRHFCCECCALIQEDRELETRASLMAPNQTGYQQHPGMVYPGH